jgi:hypothetical protein
MAYDAMEMLAGLFGPAGRPGPAYVPDELRMAYEERAGIMEYHGGLPRRRAERLALEETQRMMTGGRTAGQA